MRALEPATPRPEACDRPFGVEHDKTARTEPRRFNCRGLLSRDAGRDPGSHHVHTGRVPHGCGPNGRVPYASGRGLRPSDGEPTPLRAGREPDGRSPSDNGVRSSPNTPVPTRIRKERPARPRTAAPAAQPARKHRRGPASMQRSIRMRGTARSSSFVRSSFESLWFTETRPSFARRRRGLDRWRAQDNVGFREKIGRSKPPGGP